MEEVSEKKTVPELAAEARERASLEDRELELRPLYKEIAVLEHMLLGEREEVRRLKKALEEPPWFHELCANVNKALARTDHLEFRIAKHREDVYQRAMKATRAEIKAALKRPLRKPARKKSKP